MDGRRRFPRAARLLAPAQFKAVLADRKALRSAHLRLQRIASPGPGARLGITVPKRQVPLATARNRIRRLIREAFRKVRGDLPALDIVLAVTARPDPDAPGLAAELDGLLARLLRSPVPAVPPASAPPPSR
jgi:ribonuclease P protein component